MKGSVSFKCVACPLEPLAQQWKYVASQQHILASTMPAQRSSSLSCMSPEKSSSLAGREKNTNSVHKAQENRLVLPSCIRVVTFRAISLCMVMKLAVHHGQRLCLFNKSTSLLTAVNTTNPVEKTAIHVLSCLLSVPLWAVVETNFGLLAKAIDNRHFSFPRYLKQKENWSAFIHVASFGYLSVCFSDGCVDFAQSSSAKERVLVITSGITKSDKLHSLPHPQICSSRPIWDQDIPQKV